VSEKSETVIRWNSSRVSGRFVLEPKYDFYWPPSRDDSLFRSHIDSQIMIVLGIPLIAVTLFTRLLADPVTWIIISLLYSILIQFPLYYLAYTRRKTTITRSEYLQILTSAERKLGVDRNVIPLKGKDSGQVITSARTPFQTGILVSKKVAELIEKHPVEGEIVLAYELAKLKRDRIFFNLLRNVGAFYYGIIFEGMFFADFILSILPLLETIPLWIPAMLLTYPSGIGIAIWYKQKAAAEFEVEYAYGLNPELATFTVFSRKKMSTEGRRHYIQEIKSNIETRRSRTLFSMIGMPLFYSSIMAAIVYFLVVNIPSSFTSLFVVAIGGIVFIFLVYSASRIGTGKPRRPDYHETPRPQKVEDEKSVQVGKILSMKTGNSDYEIRSSFDIFEDLDMKFYDVHVGGYNLWVSDHEWNLLESPELISAYIEGKLARRKAGIGLKSYAVPVIAFLALLLGGFAYFIFMVHSPALIIVGWTIFSFIDLGILLMILIRISNKRQFNREFAIARQNPQYTEALHILATKSDPEIFHRKEIKERLERIERRQRKLETQTSFDDKLH